MVCVCQEDKDGEAVPSSNDATLLHSQEIQGLLDESQTSGPCSFSLTVLAKLVSQKKKKKNGNHLTVSYFHPGCPIVLMFQ